MTRKSSLRMSIVAIVATIALALTVAPAFAQGRGGGGEETAVNNLSVPAIFVPDASSFTSLVCPGGPIAPSGTTTEYSGVTYYVQGQAIWQAQCDNASPDTLNVSAAWGDNLTGAPLKAGSPIRVELGLLHTLPAGITMTGYTVENLTPSLEDRNSTYGTTGTPVDFSIVRVWDSGVTFSIHNDTTDSDVVAAGTPATAEINATGAVVYGYNWGSGKGASRTTVTAGTYTITFTAPSVTFVGTDAGTVSADGHSVSLTVTVNASSGRGGSGGGGHRGGR